MARPVSPLIKQATDNYLTRHTSDTRENMDNGEVVRCDKCGHEIRIGEFPFCPHGRGTALTIGDSIPGGIFIDNALGNVDGTARRYDSHSDIKKEAEKRGFTNVVTHVGTQGGDRSKHTTRHI